jgi:hypothetical protein
MCEPRMPIPMNVPLSLPISRTFMALGLDLRTSVSIKACTNVRVASRRKSTSPDDVSSGDTVFRNEIFLGLEWAQSFAVHCARMQPPDKMQARQSFTTPGERWVSRVDTLYDVGARAQGLQSRAHDASCGANLHENGSSPMQAPGRSLRSGDSGDRARSGRASARQRLRTGTDAVRGGDGGVAQVPRHSAGPATEGQGASA